MYDIAFNGVNAKTKGLIVQHRPSIPAPEEEIEIIKIAGKDGILTGDSRLNTIDISVDFAFKVSTDTNFATQYRTIKEYLQGSGELIQSDDTAWFYKVNYVHITDVERTMKKYATLKAVFSCDPYTYRVDGKTEVSVSRTITNNYDLCHPKWVVYGSGTRTLTVNGTSVSVTGNNVIIIDTDRMITTIQTTGGFANTRLTGDYEALYLNPGSNTATCTSTLKCIPNWRKR